MLEVFHAVWRGMQRQSGPGIPVMTSLSLYLNAVKVFHGPHLVRNLVLLWAISVSKLVLEHLRAAMVSHFVLGVLKRSTLTLLPI